MPMLDAVFVGKIYLPEVGGGPIQPPGQPPSQPPGVGIWPSPPGGIPPAGGYPGYPAPPGGIGIWPQPPGGIPPVGGYPGYPAPPGNVGIWPQPPGGIPPVGGYPGYPAPPDQIWPKPDFPHVGGGPIIPPTEPPVLWPPPGVVSPPIYLPPQIWPTPPTKPPVEGQPPEIWPNPDFPHVSQPISGGGYIIGWSPQLGYVKIPLGGASGKPEVSPTPPEVPVATPQA